VKRSNWPSGDAWRWRAEKSAKLPRVHKGIKHLVADKGAGGLRTSASKSGAVALAGERAAGEGANMHGFPQPRCDRSTGMKWEGNREPDNVEERSGKARGQRGVTLPEV
jgi:hypothetical protein